MFFNYLLENYSDNIDWEIIFRNKNIPICFIEKELKENKNPDKVNWNCLLKNPKAIKLIEKILENQNNDFCFSETKINWKYLFRNPAAIHLIEEELKRDKFCLEKWNMLCRNPAAIHLIEEEINRDMDSLKIGWKYLCRNPAAIKLIEKILNENENPNNNFSKTKINWKYLCRNPAAIHLIEKELLTNPDNIDWGKLCSNPAAIHLIEKELSTNPDTFIYWCWFQLSKNPYSISLIETSRYNPDWGGLSGNPNALHLIEKQLIRESDKFQVLTTWQQIDWYELLLNPAIFDKIYWSPLTHRKYFTYEDRQKIIEIYLYLITELPKEIVLIEILPNF